MKLVFLSYINRSGSSFLCQQLSLYNNVFVFPEGEALLNLLLSNLSLTDIKKIFKKIFKTDKKLINWQLTDKEIDHILDLNSIEQIFIETLIIFKNRYNSKGNILIFKNRDVYQFYNKLEIKLKKLIETDIIFLIRDPRAIYFSQKNTINTFTNKIFNKNPLLLSYTYGGYIQKILSDFSNKLIIIYENILNNFNSEFMLIKNNLGLENYNPNKECCYFNLISNKEKIMHTDIKMLPIKGNSLKWDNKLKRYEIKIINYECSQYYHYFGYDPTFVERCNIIVFLFYKSYFKLRIILKIDLP